MRIISKFVDYYDCIQGMGYDKELVYVREEHHYEDSACLKTGIKGFFDCEVRPGIVIFCDQAYPFLEINFWEFSEKLKRQERIDHFCWTPEAVDKLVATKFEKNAKALKYYDTIESEKRYRWSWRWWTPAFSRSGVRLWWQKNTEVNSYAQKLVQKHDAPVIRCRKSASGHETVVNGSLKDVEFFRKIDPYTAYQELSMWVGAHAWPNRHIPEVSDQDMIVAKGFDLKDSFRKDPGKIKPRKLKKHLRKQKGD